jgi:hypothetical protein
LSTGVQENRWGGHALHRNDTEEPDRLRLKNVDRTWKPAAAPKMLRSPLSNALGSRAWKRTASTTCKHFRAKNAYFLFHTFFDLFVAQSFFSSFHEQHASWYSPRWEQRLRAAGACMSRGSWPVKWMQREVLRTCTEYGGVRLGRCRSSLPSHRLQGEHLVPPSGGVVAGSVCSVPAPDRRPICPAGREAGCCGSSPSKTCVCRGPCDTVAPAGACVQRRVAEAGARRVPKYLGVEEAHTCLGNHA